MISRNRKSKQNANANALSRLPRKGKNVGLHLDEESEDVNMMQVPECQLMLNSLGKIQPEIPCCRDYSTL